MPIIYGDWEERQAKIRKMVPDLVKDNKEEIIVNLSAKDKVDQHIKALEGDNFNQEDYEFYEESDDVWKKTENEEVQSKISVGDKVDQDMETIEADTFNHEDYEFYEEVTDESDAYWGTTKDNKVCSEISEGDVDIFETLDKDMETLEGDDFNQEDYEFYEEISNETLEMRVMLIGKATVDEVHSKISEGDVENLETVDGSEAIAQNFLDLPNELILKVLSYQTTLNLCNNIYYSEPKDLISCGQVSKRLRKISHDNSLWQRVNLSLKNVKAEFLEMILSKECKSLLIYDSIIFGSLSLLQKSHLKNLGFSGPEQDIKILEEILSSCCSLEELDMSFTKITPKMAVSICQNSKTLQILNLFNSFGDVWSYLQIIKCCQKLKEIDLESNCEEENEEVNEWSEISDDSLEFLAKNMSPHVEILNLEFTDNHIKTLFSRCNKIKKLSISVQIMTDDSLTSLRENLKHTLEELTLSTGEISFIGLLELKSMTRLKLLNLEWPNKYYELFYLRKLLPHLEICTQNFDTPCAM